MSTYVFVAGGGWGGFIWRPVASLLRVQGHDVFTPTLTGLGERVHLASAQIGLETHLQDIVGVLEYEDLQQAILVGHSYGGIVITGVAERVPHRLAHLIYLDALVPQDGQSGLDLAGSALRARIERRVSIRGDGWCIPPPPGSPAKMTPSPFKPLAQPLTIKSPAAARLPRTFIYCTRTGVECLDHIAARVRAEGWQYFELETGHMAMLTAPKELAAILLELAQPTGFTTSQSKGEIC
jgi:pimeloyl-ACP methyl ester carboxylesterase